MSLLQAACFLGPGFFLPFFPIWLQGRSLSPSIIGIVVAIPIVVRTFVTAPLVSLADGPLGARRLLLISLTGQLLGFPLLMLAQDGATIMVLVAMIAVTQAGIIPINDLVITSAIHRHKVLDYGRMRGIGSMAFVVANIAAGYLVGAFGPNAVLVALSLFPLLGLAAALFAVPHDIHEPSTRRGDQTTPDSRKLPQVLWILIIATALTQGSHGALNGFASIHWQKLGIPDATIGYFWAVGVIAEIMVFMLLGRAVGRGYGLGLMLIGSSAAIVRFSILALNPGVEVTLVLQAMHGLSFGATHLGTMAALSTLSPVQARGRAQGVYASLACFTNAVTTVASGMIYKDVGAAIFAAMVPMAVMGLALTMVAATQLKAQPQREG
ncbi:MFS transporter [Microvirga terricola]|uniref:MFS transporter n=1 Tax=Microvirga terricola TaxID=2719797 RepID=A0ABX0V9M3_9HYPH|nr:MFS transporter [Microvirga terricola]NIX76514.1 MFS transporter [Microvirga terricola]